MGDTPIYIASDQGNGAYGTANHGPMHLVGTPTEGTGVGEANRGPVNIGANAADVDAPPVNVVAPLVSDFSSYAIPLVCTTGTWTGSEPITYTYQWKRDGIAISGETTSVYYPTEILDQGTSISCTVTATNAFGASSADSNSVAIPDNGLLLAYQLDGSDTTPVRTGGDDFLYGDLDISSNFDGSTQYYNANGDLSLFNSIGTGAFSMAIRFNTNNVPAFKTLAGTGTGIGGTFEFRLQDNGRINFRTQGTILSSTANLANYYGTWKTVIITCSGANGTFKYFVNGVKEGGDQVAQNYNITGASNIDIGRRAGGTQEYEGFLCDYRLWNTELSEADAIAWCEESNAYYPTDSQAGVWLDGRDISNISASAGFSSAWSDKSGNGNDLTQASGPLQPAWDGQTMSFVNGDIMSKTAQNNLLANDSTHIFCFVMDVIDPATSTQTFINIFKNDSAASGTFEPRRPNMFYGQASDLLAASDGVGNSSEISSVSTKTGNQIVSLVNKGSTYEIYLNGVLEQTLANTSDTSITPLELIIGDINVQNLAIKYDDIVGKAGDSLDDTREDMEGHLAWKLPGVLKSGVITDPSGTGNPNLPVGHKWKNEPPTVAVVPLTDDDGNFLTDGSGNFLFG